MLSSLGYAGASCTVVVCTVHCPQMNLAVWAVNSYVHTPLWFDSYWCPPHYLVLLHDTCTAVYAIEPFRRSFISFRCDASSVSVPRCLRYFAVEESKVLWVLVLVKMMHEDITYIVYISAKMIGADDIPPTRSRSGVQHKSKPPKLG